MNKELKPEQTEYAVTFLRSLVDGRGIKQTELANDSRVAQSEISKILSGGKTPSFEQLEKLSNALGFKLSPILDEIDESPKEIFGYLATPLTSVVADQTKEKSLLCVVKKLRGIASATEFPKPFFNLYWPGDFTHPVNNKHVPAEQVYITDRSRASTFDFIVLFCAEPSYGVGQENEISTQAGLPAIRLIPNQMSRMMLGSFIRSTDVLYSGSLDTSVDFDESQFKAALWEIRRMYFRFQASYSQLNGNDFGERLRFLVNDRIGDNETFADDIGISLTYLDAMMKEPLIVSNPSAGLLKRMSAKLRVSVGYLLGEAPQVDPIITESRISWVRWLKASPRIDGVLAVEIKEDWENEARYARAASIGSARNRVGTTAMKVADWDRRYRKKVEIKGNGPQQRLF